MGKRWRGGGRGTVKGRKKEGENREREKEGKREREKEWRRRKGEEGTRKGGGRDIKILCSHKSM